MAERKRFSKWWRRLFVFECATCGKDERRAIDNVSLVKLRNLKDLCDLSQLKEPENWRTEICESEGCLPLRPKACECTGPSGWMIYEDDLQTYTVENGRMILKEQWFYKVRLTCKQFQATKDEINFGKFLRPEQRPRQGDFRSWLTELMRLPETTLRDMADCVTVDDSIIDDVKRWRDAVAKSAATQYNAKDKAKKGATQDKAKDKAKKGATQDKTKDKVKRAGGTKAVTKTKAKAATRKAAAKNSIEKPDPIAQADNWDWFLEVAQQTDPGNAV